MSMDWKLKDVLEANKITVYKLANVSGVPRNTLYNLTNKTPARIDLGTLEAVLGALWELTGKELTPNDLLERRAPQPQPDAEPDPALWLAAGLGTLEQAEPYDWAEGEAEEGAPLSFEEGQNWGAGV